MKSIAISKKYITIVAPFIAFTPSTDKDKAVEQHITINDAFRYPFNGVLKSCPINNLAATSTASNK